jgi:hypothetical protein
MKPYVHIRKPSSNKKGLTYDDTKDEEIKKLTNSRAEKILSSQ